MLAGPLAPLTLGGEAPVRVELDLPAALERPAETAAQLAVDLATLRDVACESILVSWVEDESSGRLALFEKELASLGLELPISLRVDLGLPGHLEGLWRGLPIRLGRVVGRVGPDASDAVLVGFSEAVRAADTEIEWELAAPAEAIPGLVRRVLALNTGEADGAIAGGPDRRRALPMLSLAPGASPHAVRVLAAALADEQAEGAPIVLRSIVSREGAGKGQGLTERALIEVAVNLGSSLCDGIGDLVSLQTDGSAAAAVDLAYRILQGARLRTTRTEYISCPSCGRTLFDLEATTARIKARTLHLSGVKIAVMGCIVNGPGEMADADFGYVGSGVGQVTLYVGKQIVERAVLEVEAPDRLVELIKANGRWVDA